MTLLYRDPVFLDHDTGQHPENAKRLLAIDERLQKTKLVEATSQPTWAPATLAQLARLHSPEYLRFLKGVAERGGGQLDADTVCSAKSYDIARFAAGAACDAVSRIIDGQDTTALCLIRPPGHHALPQSAMGFCLLGNVAIAARWALDDCQLDRVLIVDWDVHHGNGTQAMFWEDPRVGFLSIHRWPFYPGTGDHNETGAGRGLGTTVNLPVQFGISRQDFLKRFQTATEAFAAKMRPQLLLVSAGFDAHREDPVGSLGLESEDFAAMTKVLLEIADVHCDGRLVSVLEGGYHPAALAESVDFHLRELLAARSRPHSLPG